MDSTNTSLPTGWTNYLFSNEKKVPKQLKCTMTKQMLRKKSSRPQ